MRTNIAKARKSSGSGLALMHETREDRVKARKEARAQVLHRCMNACRSEPTNSPPAVRRVQYTRGGVCHAHQHRSE